MTSNSSDDHKKKRIRNVDKKAEVSEKLRVRFLSGEEMGLENCGTYEEMKMHVARKLKVYAPDVVVVPVDGKVAPERKDVCPFSKWEKHHSIIFPLPGDVVDVMNDTSKQHMIDDWTLILLEHGSAKDLEGVKRAMKEMSTGPPKRTTTEVIDVDMDFLAAVPVEGPAFDPQVGARRAGEVIRKLVCNYDVCKWRNNLPMYARICACVKTLIRAQAELNEIPVGWLEPYSGASILHIAAEKENVQVLKLLLEGRADVNAALQSGKTTLHLAAEARHAGMVFSLLKARAEVDAQTTTFLDTPLHIAIKNRDLDVVKLLLKHKADINARNSVGTALYWANKIQEFRPLPQMIRLLKQQSTLQKKPLVNEHTEANLILPPAAGKEIIVAQVQPPPPRLAHLYGLSSDDEDL